MSFDWDKAKIEARGLTDEALLQRAKASAYAFVVLWREADGRAFQGDFRMEVSILQDRIGIIVEGHRRQRMKDGETADSEV